MKVAFSQNSGNLRYQSVLNLPGGFFGMGRDTGPVLLVCHHRL